jgi:hypothetical protein
MEANPEDIKSVAEQQKVPKEEAAVETIGALKDQYGNRHLAVGRHQKSKKPAQVDGESRKKLAASSRRRTHLAVSTPRKIHGR